MHSTHTFVRCVCAGEGEMSLHVTTRSRWGGGSHHLCVHVNGHVLRLERVKRPGKEQCGVLCTATVYHLPL